MEDLDGKIDVFFKTPAGVTFANMDGVKEFIRIIKDWVKDYVSEVLKKNEKTYYVLCFPIIYTRDNPEFKSLEEMSNKGNREFSTLLKNGYQIQQSSLCTMMNAVYVHYILVKEI